jgi:membrane protease YdiL (CAAX protease family)
MITLRLLSVLAGFLVLIVPAALLADTGISGGAAAAALLSMALASGIFIYIGITGDRMRRNARTRMLGAALLTVPIAGSLGLMATRHDEALIWASGILLGFSLVLLMSFIVPLGERRQRPMRRREGLV